MNEKTPETTDHGDNATPTPEKHSSELGELRTRAVAVRPQARLLYDPDVTIEEYMYYAAKARAEEDATASQKKGIAESESGRAQAAAAGTVGRAKKTFMDVFVPSAGGGIRELKGTGAATDDGGASVGALRDLNLSDPQVRATISDEEWTNASRAMRTATAAACFYLLTTDILGPFGVGFAMGTMGWGEGIGLYTVFGAFAGV